MSEKMRVQVLLTEGERERFRRCADEVGTSLSTWFREAAVEKAECQHKREPLDTVEKLEAFFKECDRIHDGTGPEPDWEDVKRMIAESKIHGLPRG